MRPYSPGGILIALTPAQEGSIPPTPSIHRLRPGLPGYLIPFAPLAFEPQCQLPSRKPPSPLVFFPISTHFTATLGIPLSSPALKIDSFHPLQGLSPCLLRRTYRPTCAPFTPNNSGQRLPPTYYRGCWHVVSRGFLVGYRLEKGIASPFLSSPTTELYDPKTFFTHAALLRQAFAHCGRFPTAASRRSMGRVSVPLWPFILSDRLLIVALVSRYLTNWLIRRRPILRRWFDPSLVSLPCGRVTSFGISGSFEPLSPS